MTWCALCGEPLPEVGRHDCRRTRWPFRRRSRMTNEDGTKTAAELIREIAAADPEGHRAAIGRAYLSGADRDPEFYPVPLPAEVAPERPTTKGARMDPRADDVVEACADALLCASALALGPPTEPTDIGKVHAHARAALAAVVERTLREGARPR